MRQGRIEHWQEIEWFKQTRIYGKVYDCDAFEEGEEMITNEVIKYHTVMGQLTVETASGSMYMLGTPADKDMTLKEIFQQFQAN